METFAAIYSRISHDPEGRQAGVERQEQDCRRMAAERGWTVLEPVYRENDTSASTKSKTRRPVFEQLLQYAESGSVGGCPGLLHLASRAGRWSTSRSSASPPAPA